MSDAPRALEILQPLSHGQPGSGLAQVARLCVADLFARQAGHESAWQAVVHSLTLADERSAAATVLEAALDLNPQSPDLWLQAVALQADGFGPDHWTRATSQAYALADRLEPEARYQLYCLCGETTCRHEEWEIAEQVFEEAVVLRPAYGRAYQGLANVLAAQNQSVPALEAGLHAVARGAGDDVFLTFLESLAERSGRFDIREKLERSRPRLTVDPAGRQAWLGAQFAARQIVLEREDFDAAAVPLIHLGQRYLALLPLMFQEPSLYRVCQAPELQQLAHELEQLLGVSVPRWQPPALPVRSRPSLPAEGGVTSELSADDRELYWIDLAWSNGEATGAEPVRLSYVILAETCQEAIAGARIAARLEQIRQDPAWTAIGETDPRRHPATAHLFVAAELEAIIPEFIQRGPLSVSAQAPTGATTGSEDEPGLVAWRDQGSVLIGANPPGAAPTVPLLIAERRRSDDTVHVRPWRVGTSRDD